MNGYKLTALVKNMFLFFAPPRPSRPGSALRTRLTLESLDVRAVPSSLASNDPTSSEYNSTNDQSATSSPSALPAPPTITGLGGSEVEHGWYFFTGRVNAASPGGLTVTLELPSGVKRTCVTEADGSFSYLCQVKTDGTDNGLVFAQTVDTNGQASASVFFDISPTR